MKSQVSYTPHAQKLLDWEHVEDYNVTAAEWIDKKC